MKKTFLYLNYHTLSHYTHPRQKMQDLGITFQFLHFLKDNYNVEMIDHIGEDHVLEEDGISYHFFKKKSNNKFVIPWKLHRFINKLSPDIIYVQSFIYLHFVTLLLWSLKKRPLLIVQHHAEMLPRSWWKRKILSQIDVLVDAYIFTSKEMAQEWFDAGILAAMNKVYEQPELSTNFKYNITIPKDKELFLWVGRLDVNKDPITVVNAFIAYQKKHKQAKLVMFYHENSLLDELRNIIAKYGLEKTIFLKGRVSRESLEKWYQTSTFFLLGSHYEGGSISLVEAMGCGCIPIVTDIAANRKMTENGKYGLLFTPGDSKDLLNKLESLEALDILSLRNSIIEHFQNNLSFEALAKGIDSIIKKNLEIGIN